MRRHHRRDTAGSQTQVVAPAKNAAHPPQASPPASSSSPPRSDPTSGPPAAAWQALLFRNDRPLGRLIYPTVEWQTLDPVLVGQEAAERGLQDQHPVGRLSLHFADIVPVAAGTSSAAAASSEALDLPVDDSFGQDTLRVQVFGRQDGTNFAAPHAFHATGRDLTAALKVQKQWQQYQARHQAARSSTGLPTSTANVAHSSTLAVQSGDGLENLQGVFNVGSWPARLKGIVCRFLIAEAAQPDPAAAADGSGGSPAAGGERREAAAAAAIAQRDMAVPQSAAEQEGRSQAAARQQRLHEPAAAPAAAVPASRGNRGRRREEAQQRGPVAASGALIPPAVKAAKEQAAGAASSSGVTAEVRRTCKAAGQNGPAAFLPASSQEGQGTRGEQARSKSRGRAARQAQPGHAAVTQGQPSQAQLAAQQMPPPRQPAQRQLSQKAVEPRDQPGAPISAPKPTADYKPALAAARARAAAAAGGVSCGNKFATATTDGEVAAVAADQPAAAATAAMTAWQRPRDVAPEPASSGSALPLHVEAPLPCGAAAAAPALEWLGVAGTLAHAPAVALPPASRLRSSGCSSPVCRPASSDKSSVCSDGSTTGTLSSQDSWRGGVPENPSEYGLPYNFGPQHPLMFQLQEHTGLLLPSQHSVPSSPQYRQQAAADRQGGGGGSSPAPPPQGPPCSPFYGAAAPARGVASMAAVPAPDGGPLSLHQRSGSCGSSGGEGGPAGAALPPVFHPVPVHYIQQQQWQHGGSCGRAEPFNPGPPFLHGHLMPLQQQQFAPRPQQPPTRAQWLRQRREAEAYSQWQRQRQQQQQQRRRRSAGWHEGAQVPPPPYSPPVPHGVPPPSCVPAGFGSLSAPASSTSSPVLQRGGGSRLGGAAAAGAAAGLAPQLPFPFPAPFGAELDLQVPASPDDSPDLERFLQAATPQLAPPASGTHTIRLADVWRWYEGPSTIGVEVPTVGGPRGPCTAHYLPYLSAVQLFVPASDGDAAAVAASASAAAAAAPGQPLPQLLSYPNGLDSWPERMRPLVQWGEGANMRDRVPLYCRLMELCGGTAESHPLLATRVADLHPLSWFAVAWYPLYCVPEAPLTARFLTFHTLASLWEAATEAPEPLKHQQLQHQQQPQAEAARQQLQRAVHEAAAAAARAQQGTGDLRPSYKSMLGGGLQTGCRPGPAGLDTATPTAIRSFPGSPTGSEAGTRSTLDLVVSCPQSVDAASSTSGSCRERARLGCSASTAAAHAANGSGSTSDGGCSSERYCSSEHAGSSATSISSPASPATSEVGEDGLEAAAAAPPLPVPVAGLVWYATGRDENWLDTLVAAPLPSGVCPPPGTRLSSDSQVVACWRGMAVLARPYPVAKGGPMGWEIQQDEMAQCAERLANGIGLVALRPRPPPPGASSAASASWDRVSRLPASELGICCPDFEFFSSRRERYS